MVAYLRAACDMCNAPVCSPDLPNQVVLSPFFCKQDATIFWVERLQSGRLCVVWFRYLWSLREVQVCQLPLCPRLRDRFRCGGSDETGHVRPVRPSRSRASGPVSTQRDVERLCLVLIVSQMHIVGPKQRYHLGEVHDIWRHVVPI